MKYSSPRIIAVHSAMSCIKGGKDGITLETAEERSVAPAYPADE